MPTQRRITPDDLARDFETQPVTALMIGAIVMGTEPETLVQAPTAFRGALDQVVTSV